MTKLRLFGRKCHFGGDDFVVSGTIEVILRVIGFLVLIIEFGRFHEQLNCDSEHLIFTFLLGLKVFFVVVIALDVVITNISARGTIIYDTPRQPLYKYLYVRFGILVLETLWTVMGSVSVISRMNQCEGRIYNLACAATIGGWMTSILQFLFIYLYFEFKTREHQPVLTTHDWEKRWKDLFCCLSSESSTRVFSFLSSLCVQLFKKEELVASDILAGLILVYHKQRETRDRLDVTDAPLIQGKVRTGANKTVLSPCIARKPWMNFKEAAHFMRFALGSYGWFYYIGLNNPIAASWRLFPKMSWIKGLDLDHIEGDGKYQPNTAAFLLWTKIDEKQIVKAYFNNRDVGEIPFIVTVDTVFKAVIVSIRGTLSLEDILVDVDFGRDDISVVGHGGKIIHGKVHKGMNISADYIYKKLMDKSLLEQAFKDREDYSLVITGHSLGAGVASLLAIKLLPLYTDLKCFAFAPPGELISESLVPYTEEFICSVVLGYDIVPRLGLHEMLNLRINILEEILHCHLPKAKIISNSILSRVVSTPPTEMLQEIESCEQAKTFQVYIDEEKKEWERLVTNYGPLVPPGQILHVLEEQTPNRAWNAVPNYYAEWTDAQPFREIVVSKRMIAHHFPDTLLYALEQLAAHEDVHVFPTSSMVSNELTVPAADSHSGYNLRSRKTS